MSLTFTSLKKVKLNYIELNIKGTKIREFKIVLKPKYVDISVITQCHKGLKGITKIMWHIKLVGKNNVDLNMLKKSYWMFKILNKVLSLLSIVQYLKVN